MGNPNAGAASRQTSVGELPVAHARDEECLPVCSTVAWEWDWDIAIRDAVPPDFPVSLPAPIPTVPFTLEQQYYTLNPSVSHVTKSILAIFFKYKSIMVRSCNFSHYNFERPNRLSFHLDFNHATWSSISWYEYQSFDFPNTWRSVSVTIKVALNVRTLRWTATAGRWTIDLFCPDDQGLLSSFSLETLTLSLCRLPFSTTLRLATCFVITSAPPRSCEMSLGPTIKRRRH